MTLGNVKVGDELMRLRWHKGRIVGVVTAKVVKIYQNNNDMVLIKMDNGDLIEMATGLTYGVRRDYHRRFTMETWEPKCAGKITAAMQQDMTGAVIDSVRKLLSARGLLHSDFIEPLLMKVKEEERMKNNDRNII